MFMPSMLQHLAARRRDAWKKRRDIVELESLTKEVLADLGITQSDIHAYVNGLKISAEPRRKKSAKVIYRQELCCPA